MSDNIRAFYMHESGAIPGVPGPNSGLWPAGVAVYVNTDTNEVVDTALFGVQAQSVLSDPQPATPEAQPMAEDPPAQDPAAALAEQRIAG